MPKISFIAPVYGVEIYLERFIESILEQSFGDFELILIDDGSLDKSPAICDMYAKKDNRIKVIHQENAGVSAARNKGIDVASGEYAYIVDSDDWLEPDAAEILYKDAISTGADVVMSDCVMRYENGNSLRMRQFSEKFYTDDVEDIMKIQQYILCQKYSPHYSSRSTSGYAAPWGKFIKMSIIRDNALRFDPYVKGIFDDGLFSLNLFEYISSFYYNAKHTYNYRILSESVSRGFKKDAIEALENSFEKINEFIVENKKEDILLFPFYAHISRFFVFRLDSYFFNQSNGMNYFEIKRKILRTLEKPFFKKAIENVKLEDLSRRYKIVIKMAREKNIFGMKMFIEIRRFYLRMNKRY